MRALVVPIVVVTSSCARLAAPLPLVLTTQARLGLAEGFGPGIVSASAHTMSYRLDAPAHVIVLLVMDDGSIEPVQPLGRGDPVMPRGNHEVAASDKPGIIPGRGRPVSLVPTSRDAEAGYWLLILSDARTLSFELESRIQALDIDANSLLDTVRQIPSALVGGRTTNWSAYYVGFAVLSRSK